MFLLGENSFMDMCLHCQACHVECPLSIDLPTLIWKAQAVYATKHGRTLRDRILGNAEILAKSQPKYLSRYSIPYWEDK